MKRKTFFQKLAQSVQKIGSSENDPYQNDDLIEEEYDERNIPIEENETFYEEDDAHEEVGELSIDMYRIPDAIVVRTMVAGVPKNSIEITVTRDRLTIEGRRDTDFLGEVEEIYNEELYWGAFERSIELPEEVDIEMAEAHENHGLLTIILPLIDRHKKTRLKIK